MVGITAHAPGSEDRLDRFGSAAVVTTVVGGALVAARNVVPVGLPCPALALTGVPCPGCGMTRAADALVHGQVLEVLSRDPAALVLITVIAALAAGHLLRSRGLLAGPRVVTAPVVIAVGGGAFLAHWLTTLATGGMLGA